MPHSPCQTLLDSLLFFSGSDRTRLNFCFLLYMSTRRFVDCVAESHRTFTSVTLMFKVPRDEIKCEDRGGGGGGVGLFGFEGLWMNAIWFGEGDMRASWTKMNLQWSVEAWCCWEWREVKGHLRFEEPEGRRVEATMDHGGCVTGPWPAHKGEGQNQKLSEEM